MVLPGFATINPEPLKFMLEVPSKQTEDNVSVNLVVKIQ